MTEWLNEGRDRHVTQQREIYKNDMDYTTMRELGLMDMNGNWEGSKLENDWHFLREFKEDILLGSDDIDESVYFLVV